MRDLPPPGAIEAQIGEFGNGAKRQIDANATQVQVVTQLKEFATLIKTIKERYAEVLNGKMASKLAA